MKTNNYIYVLEHINEITDYKKILKFIGAFSSLEKAKEAIEKSKNLPAFKDAPDGFSIIKRKIDTAKGSINF